MGVGRVVLVVVTMNMVFFICGGHDQVTTREVEAAASSADVHHHLNVVKGSASRRLLPFLDCGGLCKGRCRLHSRPNVCTRACGTCCARCKCVPPGTSGNREMCGTCYTDMTTHGNKPKCP